MCPSTRSLPSWGAPRPRRGSWRAGPAAGSKGRLRFPTPISPASERSSTPSWPPPEAATSTRCSRCSTPTSCFEPRGAVPPGASRVVRGAPAVAEQALAFARLVGPFARPALVNGAAGIVAAPGGQAFSVLGFTVTRGKIVEIDILADPARLRRLDLADLED